MVHVTGELPLYGNSCFKENDEPLDRATFTKATTSQYTMCKDVLSSLANPLDSASDPETVEIPTRDKDDQKRIQESILTYLEE